MINMFEDYKYKIINMYNINWKKIEPKKEAFVRIEWNKFECETKLKELARISEWGVSTAAPAINKHYDVDVVDGEIADACIHNVWSKTK